jgi:hypothetical protein
MITNIHAAESPRNRRPFKKFSRARKRLRELERIISDRHGCVPATDDADLYLGPVANCFYAIAAGRDRSVSVDGIVKLFWFWCQCQRWAPHVSSDEATEIVRHVHAGSSKLVADDVLGKALRLTYADRDRLKIRAIGCLDADKALRKKLAKARRRERDRLRAAEKRKANGATPRSVYEASSLSKTKPWEAEGISRRTYERRRKKAAVRTGDIDASASPHLADVDASASPHPCINMGRRTCVSAPLDLKPEPQRRAPQASRRKALPVLDGEIILDRPGDVACRAPPPTSHTQRAMAFVRRKMMMEGRV